MENNVSILELINSSNLELLESSPHGSMIIPINLGISFGEEDYDYNSKKYKVGDLIMYFDKFNFNICRVKITNIKYNHYLQERWFSNEYGVATKQFYIYKELYKIEFENSPEQESSRLTPDENVFKTEFDRIMLLDRYENKIKEYYKTE